MKSKKQAQSPEIMSSPQDIKKQRERQRQRMRDEILKKKKQKNLLAKKDDIRVKLQYLIENKNQGGAIEMLKDLNPTEFLKMLMLQNMMKNRILFMMIENEDMILLDFMNSWTKQKNMNLSDQLILYGETGTKLLIRIIKIIMQKFNKSEQSRKFVYNLLPIIQIKESILYYIFQKNITFDLIKQSFTQNKYQLELLQFIVDVVQKLQRDQLFNQFSQYLLFCKSEKAWSINNFKIVDKYTQCKLKQISYNIYHQCANTLSYEGFFTIKQNESEQLYNQFNCGNQTPIDIALRLFNQQGLKLLYEFIKNNDQIKLTTKCLCKVLSNKNINNNEEINKWIELIKEKQQSGYLKKLTNEKLSEDVIQFSDFNDVLKQIDGTQIALVRYIKKVKKYDYDIINKLIINQLKNYTIQYQSLLKINQTNKIISYFNQKHRNDKNFIKYPLLNSNVLIKNSYVTQNILLSLYDIIFNADDQDLLLTLVKVICPSIFLQNIECTLSYRNHVLEKVVQKKYKKVFQYFLENFNKIIQCKQEIDISKFKQSENILKEYSFDMLNYIVNNFHKSKILNDQNNQLIHQLKQKLKSQYNTNALLYKSIIFEDGVFKFIINRIPCFLNQSQTQQVFKANLNMIIEKQDIYLTHFYEDIFSNGKSVIKYLHHCKNLFSKFIQKSTTNIEHFNILFQAYFNNQNLRQDFFEKIKQMNSSSLLKWLKILKDSNDFKTIQIIAKNFTAQNHYLGIHNLIHFLHENIDVKNYDKQLKIINSIQKQINLEQIYKQSVLKKINIRNDSNLLQTIKALTILGCNTFILENQIDKKKTVESLNKILKSNSSDQDKYFSSIILTMIKSNSSFIDTMITRNSSTLNNLKQILKKSSKFLILNCIKFIQDNFKFGKYLFEVNKDNFNYFLLQQIIKNANQIGFQYDYQDNKENILNIFAKYGQNETINQYFQEIYPSLIDYSQLILVSKIKSIQQAAQQQTNIIQSLRTHYQKLNALFSKFKNIINIKSINLISLDEYRFIGKHTSYLKSILECILLKLPEQKLMQICQYSINQNYITQSLQEAQSSLIKFICSTADPELALNKTYFGLLKILKNKIEKQSRIKLNYKLLSKVYFINPQFATLQLVDNLVEQEITIQQINNLTQLIRFKGYPDFIYKLLFMREDTVKQLKIFHITQLVGNNAKVFSYCGVIKPQLCLKQKHFNQYINSCLSLSLILKSKYNTSQKLLNIIINLAKHLQWNRLNTFIALLQKNKIPFYHKVTEIFRVLPTQIVNTEFNKVVDIIYKQLKKYIKSLEVSALLNVYNFKPEVIVDFNFPKLLFTDYLKLLSINYKSKQLTTIFKNIIPINFGQGAVIDQNIPNEDLVDRTTFLNLLKIVINKFRKELAPTKVQYLSRPYYLNILKHCKFISDSYKVEQEWYLKAIKKIQNSLLQKIQTDENVLNIYSSTNINDISRRIFTSKAIKSYKNYLKLYPNMLDGQIRQNIYKKLILKFSNENIINELLSKNIFKLVDFKYVIYTAHFEIVTKYLSKLPVQTINIELAKPQIVQLLLNLANEQFSIKIIKKYGLENNFIEFRKNSKQFIKQTQQTNDIEINIFHIICSLKRNKILNYFYRYLKQKKLENVIEQLLFKTKPTALDYAQQYNYYQLLFVWRSLDKAKQINDFGENFNKSSRFLFENQFTKIKEDLPDLSNFMQKIQFLKLIKNFILTGEIQSNNSQSKSIKPPSLATHQRFYDIHGILLQIVFRLKDPSILGIKELKLNSIRFQAVISMKFLTFGVQLQDIKYLNYELIIILILHDQADEKTQKQIFVQFPEEMKIINFLKKFLPNKINLNNVLERDFSSFIVAQNITNNQKIIKFLFKIYSKNIIYNASNQFISENIRYICYLLPQFSIYLDDINNYNHYTQQQPQQPIKSRDLYNAAKEALIIDKRVLLEYLLVVDSDFRNKMEINELIQQTKNEYEESEGQTKIWERILNLSKSILSDSERYFLLKLEDNLLQLGKLSKYHKGYLNAKYKQSQIHTYLKVIINFLKKQFEEVQFDLFQTKIKEFFAKNQNMIIVYTRFSLFKIYWTVKSALTTFYKQIQSYHCDYIINFIPKNYDTFDKSIISLNNDVVNISAQINIITNPNQILLLQINLNEHLSQILQNIQNVLFMKLNIPYINQSIQDVKKQRTIFEQILHANIINIKVDSFEKISNIETKVKVFNKNNLLTKSQGILGLKQFYSTMQRKYLEMKNTKIYELTDILAPHSNHANLNILFIEFYELLKLPGDSLNIEFLSEQKYLQQQKFLNQKIYKDLSIYIEYFKDHIMSTQQEMNGIISKYSNNSFCDVIYYSYFSKENRVKFMKQSYSVYNIIEIFYIFYAYQKQINQDLINFLNLRIGVNSFTQICFQIIQNNPLYPFYQIIRRILNCSLLKQLILQLSRMIIDKASNIMNVIKGIRIDFKKIQKCKQSKYIIFKNPLCAVDSIKYEIIGSILIVTINTFVQKISGSTQKLIQPQNNKQNLPMLIVQKDFLDCLFSTSEQLTNYFIFRSALDTSVLKMAKNITDLYEKMINITIDYDCLYRIVKYMQQKKQINQIEHYLNTIYNYLTVQISQKLIQEFQSTNMSNIYTLYLQYCIQSVLEKKHVNEMFSKCQLEYNLKQLEHPLTFLFNNYTYFNQSHKKYLRNSFFIQIYKSYFSNSSMQGNRYILGYKNGTKEFVTLTDKSAIQKIQLQNIRWVLWVTKKIPDENFLDYSKVIRIYISDLSGDLYLVNNKFKEYLLRQTPQSKQMIQSQKNDIEINKLIPVIPSNILIKFKYQHDGIDEQQNMMMHSSLNLQKHGSMLRDLYSSKSTYIKLNDKEVSIKSTSFEYIDINISQQLRLNQKIMSRIKLFIDNIKQVDKDTNLQLKIRFSQSLQSIKEIETFQKLFNWVLYEFEKSMQEYSKTEKRISKIQQNSIIFTQNLLLNKNLFQTLRLNKFRQYFQVVQFLFNTGEGSKIQINQQNIILKVDINPINQNFGFINILHEIISVIITRLIKQINSTQFKIFKLSLNIIIKLQTLELNQKIKLLDILLTILQIGNNITVALEIYSVYSKSNKVNFKKVDIYVGNSNSTLQINKQGQQLKLQFNIKEAAFKFYTFCDILEYLYFEVRQNDILTLQKNQFAEYDYDNNNFSIYNYHAPIDKFIMYTSKKVIEIQQNFIKYQHWESGIKFVIQKNLNILQERFIFLCFLPNKILYNIYNPKVNIKNMYALKSTCYIDQDMNFFFNILNTELNILPIDKIQLYYKIKNSIFDLLKPVPNIQFKLSLLTRNILNINVKSAIALNLTLQHPILQFPYQLIKKQKSDCIIEIKSLNAICIEKTQFLGVMKNGKLIAPKEKVIQKNLEDLFKEPPEKVQYNKMSKQVQSKISEKQVIQNQRPLNLMKDQYKYLTKAGTDRIDIIRLCDQKQNRIDYDLDDLFIFFEYCDNSLLKYYPLKQKIEKDKTILLKWTPIVRGRYRLYINQVIIDPGYEIVISAHDVNFKNTKALLPNIKSISYCEQSTFSVVYKDLYGNIFGDIQYETDKQNALLEAITSEQALNDPNTFKVKVKDVDKVGNQNVKFELNMPHENSERIIKIQILFMRQLLDTFEISVKGLSAQKRKENFNIQLNKIRKNRHQQILVNRLDFLEQLLNYEKTDLNTNISVRFNGEAGIDAGGLKREFYDLIGVQLKNEKYPFFKPILGKKLQYILNPDLIKNKKKEKYMKVFGKFLANSILNNYLIGIDFADAFIKALYDKQIQFNDLKQILDHDEFKRYESLLSLGQQDFADLELYFNFKQIELKQDGSKILVDSHNVRNYLNFIAEYYIKKRYGTLIDNFLEGFNQVFPFTLIKNWFKPHEFSTFTCGKRQLNFQTLNQVLIFTGGSQIIIGWFKRYIQQCPVDLLIKFLKFTTGSSSIPFDTTSYKIQIQFVNMGNNPKKLPIAHTCWKCLEVPIYKSYQVMQKKLTAAFVFGAEGFGFA